MVPISDPGEVQGVYTRRGCSVYRPLVEQRAKGCVGDHSDIMGVAESYQGLLLDI